MPQIAIRLTRELLAELDAMMKADRGRIARTALIRDLLWEGIDARKRRGKP